MTTPQTIQDSAFDTKYLVVYVTMPNKAAAEVYCKTLVGERLAACANILDGVSSIYWWNDNLETTAECVCFFKTTQARFPAFLARATEEHPYEVPCIVAWPPTGGDSDYFQWINIETSM